jgi:Ran GTPase-activating protein (RanGAP) involved in mRNA processing and transport
MILLADCLAASPNLKELDISLNEIGPSGFQALCDVLPQSQIHSLTCSKNFLGDEVLGYFANILTDTGSGQPCKLKKFDFSSCRLNDTGLIYLINALQFNKQINIVRL